MNRKYKVKHYRSRIYNPIRGKITKAVIVVLAAAILFTVGWFSYEPLMKAINEKNKEIVEDTPVPPKPQEQAYEPVPEEFLEKETVAVTVPEEVLYDSLEFYGFLKELDSDVTAVVIDMKTKSGTVTYLSGHTSVISAGAFAENAIDLGTYIKIARSRGLDVIARIYAFEDSTTPFNAGDMAIRYESEDGVLWLDDSVDNGGKPWLNPYSDTAQKYILDIVNDAIDSGVDAILLEGVRFPEDDGMDYAYFGVGAEGVSKKEILKQFTGRIYSTAVVTDTDVIIGYESYAAITGSDIYGESPTEFSADGYAPYININDFVGKKINDDFYFKKMPEDITEVFIKIYESLGSIEGLDMMPVISCEGFTKAQMRQVFEYLETKGTAGYILVYDGPYFTGIPEEPEEPVPEVPPANVPITPNVPQNPTPAPEKEPESEEQPEMELPGKGEEGYQNPGVTVTPFG